VYCKPSSSAQDLTWTGLWKRHFLRDAVLTDGHTNAGVQTARIDRRVWPAYQLGNTCTCVETHTHDTIHGITRISGEPAVFEEEGRIRDWISRGRKQSGRGPWYTLHSTPTDARKIVSNFKLQ